MYIAQEQTSLRIKVDKRVINILWARYWYFNVFFIFFYFSLLDPVQKLITYLARKYYIYNETRILLFTKRNGENLELNLDDLTKTLSKCFPSVIWSIDTPSIV